MRPIAEEKILSAIRAELDHMHVEGGFESQPHTTWAQLCVDSLDLVELAKALEDRFAIQIPDCAVRAMLSVSDAIFVVRSLRIEAAAA